MAIWVVIGLVLLLALLSWADARDKVNLPKRSWNIWVGPKPRDGESEAIEDDLIGQLGRFE